MKRGRTAQALLVLIAGLGAAVFWLRSNGTPVLPPGRPVPLVAGERPIRPLGPGENIRPPVFDIVRIEPTGRGAASGRAEPDARIHLQADGQTLASAQADERGEWVMMIGSPIPPGEHMLTLLAELADGRGIAAPDRLFIALPQRPSSRPLVVRMAPDTATQVLQRPDGPSLAPVSLEAIDLGADGALRLGGRANPGQALQLYLDNGFLGEARADGEGRWHLPEADDKRAKARPGPHVIRLDGLDAQGHVVSRQKLTFDRQASAAEPGLAIESGEGYWRIRQAGPPADRDATIIYGAAAGQALDPKLYFPGQVKPEPAPEILPAADH